jgi:DNA ligase-1
MKSFVEVLRICESANGAGSKAVIKQALSELDPTGRKLMNYCMNPYMTFGVKKFDMPRTEVRAINDYYQFFEVLDKLSTRELSGNAAREAVTKTLSQFPSEDQPYFARVIGKDPKAGFSAETFNKIWPTEQIPTFSVMLAGKCEDEEQFESKITFPCQADWKYDGERTIAIVKDGVVNYYSRSGIEATHVDGLFDAELLRIRDYLHGMDFVLDGERMSINGFIDTVNAKKAGNAAAKANLRFRAFFLMPLSDWIAQSTGITMKKNREILESILAELNCEKIILSGGREVQSYADMVTYTKEVTTPGFDGMKDGHEGLILKDWSSPYVWDRSIAWCKVKNFYDADARIIGFLMGRKGTKYENTVGRINVRGILEDGTIFECGVGSGLTDELRDDILANPDKYMKLTTVVNYQEVSKSKNKEFASLRFPTLTHFRDDKLVEV